MGLIRKFLALLAWVMIYIPTTLFVVAVMIKVYLEQRRSRNGLRAARRLVESATQQEERA
jgi:Tfp pilus assembly protein PilX